MDILPPAIYEEGAVRGRLVDLGGLVLVFKLLIIVSIRINFRVQKEKRLPFELYLL